MTTFLFVMAGFVVLLFLTTVFGTSFHPLRWIGRLAVRLLIGVFFLFLLNVVGQSFSLHIPINIATASVSGLLGIPGVAALVLIKYTTGV